MECTPYRGACSGGSVSIHCERPVYSLAPHALLCLQRRLDLARVQAAPHSFRCVSYNILWGRPNAEIQKQREKKAKSEVGGGQGQIPATPACPCPHTPISHVSQLPVALEAREYRQHIALWELRSYKADVICLQEVTGTVFRSWHPVLAEEGCAGLRSGESGELAIFWRKSRFEKEAEATWLVCSLLDGEENAGLRSALDAVPHLKAFFMEKPHIAQVVTFRCTTTHRRITVVNVHLIMHGMAASLRALQACLVLRRLHRWEGCGDDLVLCGDFNCRGYDASLESVFALLETGSVPEHHSNFWQGRDLGRPVPSADEQCMVILPHRPRCLGRAVISGGMCLDHTCFWCKAMKMPREHMCMVCSSAGKPVPAHSLEGCFAQRLTQPLGRMASAVQKVTGNHYLFVSPWRPTDGTPWLPHGWGEMKDHIFYSNGLQVTWLLPPPAFEDMRGMPSLSWASDHLAIVADLEVVSDD